MPAECDRGIFLIEPEIPCVVEASLADPIFWIVTEVAQVAVGRFTGH